MSHVVIGSVEVKNVEAVKAACARLGIEFREGQKTFTWYGRHVGDYPLPAGTAKGELGQCAHALHAPGINYEVGLVPNPATGGFKLAYDFYGDGQYGRHDGQKLQSVVGKDCGKFLQAYGVEFTKMQARAKGLMVTERTVGEEVKLTIGGF